MNNKSTLFHLALLVATTAVASTYIVSGSIAFLFLSCVLGLCGLALITFSEYENQHNNASRQAMPLRLQSKFKHLQRAIGAHVLQQLASSTGSSPVQDHAISR
jgi:hypothetical protein